MNIKKGYNFPKSLELKSSPIHGLGIFATEFIPIGTNLGTCHYYDFTKIPTKHLRNPIVGFINYSVDKNAHLPIAYIENNGKTICTTKLVTLKNIQKGEEILLKYTWYDPTKPDTEKNRHYIPLPDCVSIKNINGKYCLYATEDISKDFSIGISHSYHNRTEVYEPNAIGGYLVESKSPNAFLLKVDDELLVKSNSIIKKGECITVNYEKLLG